MTRTPFWSSKISWHSYLNEGGVGGKGIKGNALRRLNAVQISRKVVNATHTRRYADVRNEFSNTL